MWKQKCLLALFCLMLALPGQAADWETVKPDVAVKAMPKGKTVKTFVSPNKKQQLLLRDEGGHGDFFYYVYYYFNGKTYTQLGSFIATANYPKVVWKKELLTFQALTPTGPDEVWRLQLEFDAKKNQLRSKVIGKEAMQAAG